MSLFVKTVQIDADKCYPAKPTPSFNNDGVKVRIAKTNEVNDIARVLSNTYRTKLSYMFNEKNEEHLGEMITSYFETNQWMLDNTLVAVESDRVQGVCCLKFAE